MSEPDDTNMTPEEFRARRATGVPVKIVHTPEAIAELREYFDNHCTAEDMEDGVWEDEVLAEEQEN